jgi:hypothetical protein
MTVSVERPSGTKSISTDSTPGTADTAVATELTQWEQVIPSMRRLCVLDMGALFSLTSKERGNPAKYSATYSALYDTIES